MMTKDEATKEETLSEITGLRGYADGIDRQIAGLEQRYGKGARPAWVGDDISISMDQAKTARAKADALEAALAA